ncbi:MAG: alpha/beta hydrolase [Bacteroidales bacterium]|nr:alpha/beta hydrolase [Bacteroidales bacterium]
MKKLFKVFLYIIGVLLLIILGLVVTLWIKSPGTADPITDINGNTLPASISSIEKVKLGGQEQYLIIRGADSTKPVMLFLHGGPGSPEIAFMKKTNQDIENDFVMVYWEQRGAGKSYSKNMPFESMNLAQFISDTQELSKILAKRFNKEKIYLIGHSWGSLLGILTAYKHPDLFYAYLGIGQVCYQYKGEQISFEWVKEQANKHNNEDAVEALSEISFPDSLGNIDAWLDYLMVERNYVTKYGGGVTHELTGMWPVIKMVLETKEYTFMEKINFMPASLFSIEHLWLEVINKNLMNEIDSMQVPVYIFQGIHDYQTPYTIAKEFYDQLKAPQKAFFTFENSAHSPMMEEVDKFNSILRENVLK